MTKDFSESHRLDEGACEGNLKQYGGGKYSFKILSQISDNETVTGTAAGKVATLMEFLMQIKGPKPEFFYCEEINGTYAIMANFKFTGEQCVHLFTLGHSLSEPELGVIRVNLGLTRDVPATEPFRLNIAHKKNQSVPISVSIDTSCSDDGFCDSPSVSKNRKSVSNDNSAQAQNAEQQPTAGKENKVLTLLARSAAVPPSSVLKAFANVPAAPEKKNSKQPPVGWETRVVEIEMAAQKAADARQAAAAVQVAALPLSPPRPAAVAKPPSAPKDRSPNIAPEKMKFTIVDTASEKYYGSAEVNSSDTFSHLLAIILTMNDYENITTVSYRVDKCHYDLSPVSEADRTLASLGLMDKYILYVTTAAPQPQLGQPKAAINNAKVPPEVAKPKEAEGENPYLATAALVGAMATLVVAAAINRL